VVAVWDLSWKCEITDKPSQEQCNRLACMGAIVSMQGEGWKAQRKQNCNQMDKTDCTCAEKIRQACVGDVLRLRENQCKAQCNANWCDYQCKMARKREYTGIFLPDNVENPFTVKKCETNGTICVATCVNEQRRVVSTKPCGKHDVWDSDLDPSILDRGSKYHVLNSKLCGGEGTDITQADTSKPGTSIVTVNNFEEMIANRICQTSQIEEYEVYRPDACTGTSAASSFSVFAGRVVVTGAAMLKLLF